MMDVLQAKNFAGLPRLRHGFFTRSGGKSEGVFASLNCKTGEGDDEANVRANLSLVAEHLGVSQEKLLTLDQIHGAEVVTVSAPWDLSARPRADAMVTNREGLALGILTADCVPVLLADVQAGVIGAVHAGWKSALAGIADNAIAAMEGLGASRSRIEAAIGPCIWQDSYEVDQAFRDRFLEQDFQNDRFFCSSETPERFLFELSGYVRDRFRKNDVAGISPSPADTFADETRFFSYRRSFLRGESQSGRQITAIVLG